MVSHSDEVNRFAYVPKDRTEELSSQHRNRRPCLCQGERSTTAIQEWAERVGYTASDFSDYDIDRCSGKAKLDCASQAEAEIESSGSARFLLIGHSAGGSAVIIAADRMNNKGQIAGIVLLDPDMTATLEDDIIDITHRITDYGEQPFQNRCSWEIQRYLGESILMVLLGSLILNSNIINLHLRMRSS